MTTEETRTDPWKELEALVDDPEPERLEAFLGSLPAVEAALCVSRIDEEHRARLLARLAPQEAAAIVEQIPDAHAIDAIGRMQPESAAAILTEMPSNQQADLLGDLDEPDAHAILAAMSPEDAVEARALSAFPDESAGGLMVTEYLAFPETATVGDAIDDMRENAERYRDYVVQYGFVTDDRERLVGVLRLRDLLLAPRSRPLGELALRNPLTMRETATLDDLRTFFDRYAYFGVPIVDEHGVLLGIVRRAGVEEALADRADDTYLKTQGIIGGEELRTMPLLLRARRRLAWLSINVVLNIMAASVIAAYQETLAAVIALAVFLPILSDMSGCSGNQAVAVSMRELSLGLVRPAETLRVWLKEITVGGINGLVLGGIVSVVAWVWQGNAWLGLVVGVAMLLNTLVAVSIGGTIPLLLRRAGVDPALASGPLLTTVTDMCGFFLLLSIAGAFLPKLVG